MIFYCNERVYITEVYIDTILFLFWKDNHLYYMDSGILLATKTLVELIRHYIRDTVRVFSVCHAH